MQCPKCNELMETLHTRFADIDRCTACKGLWFDTMEYRDVMKIANEVDTGDPEVGKRFNEKEDTYCPVCPDIKMLNMVDPQQPHIYFESCPTCYGRYYDAGELKDLAEETLMDFVRMLLAEEREP